MARILVIDDDELFVKLMVHTLSERGHKVEFAHDGEAGERAFDTNEFDVVICDLMMPHQDGLETIRYMRSTAPSLAIIAISSGLERAAELDILVTAKLLGASATLQKPFKLSQLAAAVDQALNPATTAPAAKAG